jgi:DNA polymerase I-like protein with 3'-5' exonuclease and polymerase domains
MLNRLIQGSAADIMKKAMLDAWQEGIFEVLVPHITVHDELDVSFPLTEQGATALWRLKEIMESCVELRVPLTSDLDVGFDWANLTSIKEKTELYGWVLENKK